VTATLHESAVIETVGGWRLVKRVAESHWFVVYLAAPSTCDPDWPADYALKLVRPALAQDRRIRQLLLREKQVSVEVSHPHLATVLDADLNHDPPFVVQPFYEGQTVRQLLVGGPLRVSRSLWITRQVAEACTSMHAAQWIHGDVKPDNVIVSALGHATVIDLGFARKIAAHMARRHDASLQTTLTYAAPELFWPQTTLTAGADVYSMGVMLYEMLTGRPPFAAEDPHELVRQHVHAEILDPRRLNHIVPLDVSQLVMRMLAKEPADRPQSNELVQRLVRLEIDCFSL